MTTGNLKRKPTDKQNGDSDSELNYDLNKKLKMVQPNQYLLAFQLVTCGLQNNDLGRDETAILQIGFQLIDVANKQALGGKIILLQASSLLDQSANPDKIHISIPAREMTELLSSPNSYSLKHLKEALNEIDIYINEYIPKSGTQPIEIVPVTIGHLPLRSVLHRETRFRNIHLNSYWYHYYNICDEVSRLFCNPVQNLEDICKALQIDQMKATTGNIVWNMSRAILHLLKCGHTFQQKHLIKCNYKPAIFHVNDEIEPDVVIMIKPIDYRTPISQVIPFFRGLNIADGGMAVVMSDGRRSNKILVKFEDKTQRDIALLRDKHHIEPGNTRFITISVFDSREFMKIAGYENEKVKEYLEQIKYEDQILVRIKGLPYTVTKIDILNFFTSNDVEIQFAYDGIFLVQKLSGDLNGDAFVIFENETVAEKAKNLKGMTIGNRYMEIFYSTPAEMNQVISAVNKTGLKSKSTKLLSKNIELNSQDALRSQSISDSTLSATITKSIPGDATDNDFVSYLGDLREFCVKFLRIHSHSSDGYISYIALFKCASDVEIVVKTLRNRSFKVNSSNKEMPVETSELILPNKSDDKSNSLQILQNVYANNLPYGYVNSLSNFLPCTSTPFSPTINFSNPLNITALNGSLYNLGVMPNMLLGNQSINMLPDANFLMINQMPVSMNIGASTNVKIFPGQDALSNAFSSNQIWSNYRSNIPLLLSSMNKSKVLLMTGITTGLSQTDLNNIFHSIASNISMIPKLLQHNQFSYAVFSCVEDANIALQRCPMILYNNQVIQLIPATE